MGLTGDIAHLDFRDIPNPEIIFILIFEILQDIEKK